MTPHDTTAMDDAPIPPPLRAAVAAVCSARAGCAPLEHVARLIDAFLDPSPFLSLENTVLRGSVRLLERVLRRRRDDVDVDVFLQQQRMRHAMQHAASRGELAMMELLHAHHPEFLAADALVEAASRNDLKMIQWLEKHRRDESIASLSPALIQAAVDGHLDVVRYLMESYDTAPAKLYCPSRALREAVEADHVDVADYLSSRGVRSDLLYVGDNAARYGHLRAVQWLHERQLHDAFSASAMSDAAREGHLDIVRFLHENRTEGCLDWIIDDAASGGYLDVVKYLYANRTEGCSERAVICAAQIGHLPLLQWLYTHFPLIVSQAIEPAAVAALASGHDEVLTWLKSQFGPLPNLPGNAAEKLAMTNNLDDLPKLQELQASTTEWSPQVLEIAARNGNVEMIQWLHEHRPDLHSTDAMDMAVQSGHFEVVKLLHEYGMAACTPSTLVMAAASGNLTLLQWVDAHCSESNVQEAMDEAASKGHLATVQWLHDHHHSQSCSVGAMERAARQGELEMVIWLHNNRSEGCTTSALDGAASTNRWEVVQWLVHNRSEGATQDGMDDAGFENDVKVLSLLHDRYGLRLSEDGVLSCAREGALDTLQWAYRVQPETVDFLIQCRREATEGTQFHVVDWIDDTLGARVAGQTTT